MAGEVDGQFAGVETVLQLDDTRVYVDDKELGSGLLSVDESNLTWRSSSGPESLVLEYPSIALHAVSRDSTVFSQHCVYLQYLLLHDESEEEEEEREEEEEKEKDDPPSVIEYRFVPASSEKLDDIYQAIMQCQMLYPDPEQSDSDEEGQGYGEEEEEEEERGGGDVEEIVDLSGGEFFTTAEGFNHLSPHGLSTLTHLERILQLPTPDEFEASLNNGTHRQLDEEPPDQFRDADQ